MAALVSVNVGMPRDVGWQGRTVHTGIYKTPVDGPVMARRLNLDGDGQGDLGGHGGEQRAVLVYQLESIKYWRRELARDDIGHGHFGENLTVTGLPDDEVCIGDRYRIGEAEFEVTQPRVTCYRVGMRLGLPSMPSLLVAHHRPGFYMRVITEGHVRAGDPISRTRRGPHSLSVAETDALLYLPDRSFARLRDAVDIPALSPGWLQSFRELLDGGGAPPVGAEPGWAGFRPLRVVALTAESSAILSVRLSAVDGTRLPVPVPGQYITVRVDGAVRSYSLSSGADDGTYRISVKRDGQVSTYLHTTLRVGSVLETAAPRGEFVLSADSAPVLLISAGVGVTPVLAMLHQLAASASAREVWWLHTDHSAPMAFDDEVRELIAALPDARVHFFLGRRQTLDSLRSLGLPVAASAYICGPQGFMEDVRASLVEIGLDPARLHTELFGARSAINPGLVSPEAARTPHQPVGVAGTGPRVTFARSGLTVRSGDGSLLELAEACDVPTRWSCRTGVCHTCVTSVLSGDVTYEPEPLERPGAGETLLCCARPAGDLVLDI
ncbi:MOSC domain-containing protein [Paractinoplanes rhizophilus]|uniref:MOSC domain-containing protein n=1 Tax=Paractinoplanes rhizophilus TaxID=1416877 RepID=A0ABW2HZB1_9ACTN